MKQTTFDEFVELSRRGTFVPVVKEIMADLLTPVSAFLKIAEHSDYAFLFESVEGGERVARYSFLGKDPFLVLKARRGKTIIDRNGVTSESDEPFIKTLRRLMAEFRSPYVPGLPRFTGGAVGMISYDASPSFEPVLQ
jgi:anthranilate synthase component 1